MNLGSLAEWVTAGAAVAAIVGVWMVVLQAHEMMRANSFQVFRDVMELLDDSNVQECRRGVRGKVPLHLPKERALWMEWEATAFHAPSSEKANPGIPDAETQPTGGGAREDRTQNGVCNQCRCLRARDDNTTFKHAAQTTARAFDRLGLLTREGRIPIEMIARFYARPVVEAWIDLKPYAEYLRKEKNQPGHWWELQNLAA